MLNNALEGVKVAALVQGVTGPLTTAIMASYGAEVLRIETRTRLEWHRNAGPFIDNIVSPDRSVTYLFVNPGVYGITLNLKHHRAMEVVTRMIQWADVVVENFAGGQMIKLGLGYEDLKKIKSDIIMLSAAIYGQTGPMAEYGGAGMPLTALTGFPNITGFPDQVPQFPGFALTDFIAPRANVLAIASALSYRNRTGKGQYIDAAQMESAVPLLNPILLDYSVNKREPARIGNKANYASPHGVYRCKGEDQWCTIAIIKDDQWHSFCQAIGKPDWIELPEFGTLLKRLENVELLDRMVDEWTVNYTAEEVISLMQSAGIAAGIVQSGEDLDSDPQLEHRHFYWKLDHPDMGSFTYSGMPARLSKTPYNIRRAPMLGEHNEYVYTELLGIQDEEYAQLMSDGVFE
jgi:benzylsuccinate CoA-transferase BbsF subunit